MSYATYNPMPMRQRRRPQPQPQPPEPQSVYPPYPIQPLSAASPPQPRNTMWRGILIAVAVVVGLLVLMYVLDRYFGDNEPEPEKPKRRRVEKMSTETLAKNLYKRLEKKGHASNTTMNALRQIGKKKAASE